MRVDIKTLPSMRAACVHHAGPYDKIHASFEKLGQIAGRAGLFQLKGAMMIGIYHDDPQATPADELQSEAGIIVPDGFPLPAGLTEQRIPGGTYACTVHTGSYDRLGDTWTELMGEWIPSSGRRVAEGPSLELYHNDPGLTPTRELKTEICVPVSATARQPATAQSSA